MAQTRGISNQKLMQQLGDQLSASGLMRLQNTGSHTWKLDVNAPVAQLEKTSALVAGVGRVQFAKNVPYLPSYNMAIGATLANASSGLVAPSDGVYEVAGYIAVSGTANDLFRGAVYVNGVAASGTNSGTNGVTYNGVGALALVPIQGIVTCVKGSTINAGVMSTFQNMVSVGEEDFAGNMPAANILIQKLPSDGPQTNIGAGV